MFLAEGCTAISRELGSLTDNIFRDTSVSVLNTINLPRMELYDNPAERQVKVKQVRRLPIKQRCNRRQGALSRPLFYSGQCLWLVHLLSYQALQQDAGYK